jgi:hypothetical protein
MQEDSQIDLEAQTELDIHQRSLQGREHNVHYSCKARQSHPNERMAMSATMEVVEGHKSLHVHQFCILPFISIPLSLPQLSLTRSFSSTSSSFQVDHTATMKFNAVSSAVLASIFLTAAVASPFGMVEQGRLERMLTLTSSCSNSSIPMDSC